MFWKRIILQPISIIFLSLSLFAVDFEARLMPAMLFSVDSPFDFIFSPGLSLNLNLITIRKRDDIYLTLQGTPLMMNAMGIDSVWAFDVDFGAGYNFRISDRFIVAAEGYGGVWTKPASKSSVSKDKKISGASEIAFGGRLSGNYYISSALKASFFLQDIKIIITNRLHL